VGVEQNCSSYGSQEAKKERKRLGTNYIFQGHAPSELLLPVAPTSWSSTFQYSFKLLTYQWINPLRRLESLWSNCLSKAPSLNIAVFGTKSLTHELWKDISDPNYNTLWVRVSFTAKSMLHGRNLGVVPSHWQCKASLSKEMEIEHCRAQGNHREAASHGSAGLWSLVTGFLLLHRDSIIPVIELTWDSGLALEIVSLPMTFNQWF
jgi:hypothetical protein